MKKTNSIRSRIDQMTREGFKKKKKVSRRYAIGSRVERMTRNLLYEKGALFVMKAGGSKIIWPKGWEDLRPKVDLIALFKGDCGGRISVPVTDVLLVQCKRRGVISKDDLRDLKRFSAWNYNVSWAVARLEGGVIIMEEGL